MKTEIPERVRYIAADIFNLSLHQITSSSSQDSIEKWDSLQHLNLILALEEAFGVQFTPEEMARMVRIDSIASLIQEKLRLG